MSCQIFHLSDIKFIFMIWVITPISRQTPGGCQEQKVKLQNPSMLSNNGKKRKKIKKNSSNNFNKGFVPKAVRLCDFT